MLMMSIYWKEAYICTLPPRISEYLVVASKENVLEVNADRTKYMVMSRDQNAGQSHNIKIHNSSFERVNSSNISEQT
jgi:hypothetical protein